MLRAPTGDPMRERVNKPERDMSEAFSYALAKVRDGKRSKTTLPEINIEKPYIKPKQRGLRLPNEAILGLKSLHHRSIRVQN